MKRTFLFMFVVLGVLLAASCVPVTPAPPAVQQQPQQVVVVTATPPPSAEKVIDGVEANATISFWTFWLSPTFDDYIKSTIARFQQTYPGVTVKWEDHQASFLDDYRNSFAAGNAPDVANLSNGEGWVSEFATKGLLINLDDAVPQNVKSQYFPGLWKVSLVNGKNYQFPWYAAVATELVNTQYYTDTAKFPKTVQELPALCASIKAAKNALCDVRLTVNDLPSQMIYEGGVKFISDDGKKFTFNSPEGVAWLQMYVDWVKAGTLDRTALVTDNDRVGLDLFTSGKAPFYQTGPQLIREVRSNNPGLYGYLAVVPAPLGKSGAIAPTAMGISVKKDTKYPKAALALAAFFTNPRSQLEFAKVVSIYPSTPASYDDPFFAAKPVAIEDQAKPIAKDIIAKQTDLKPSIPKFKDVNDKLLQAVQQALFNGVPAQKALDDAVAASNALIAQ